MSDEDPAVAASERKPPSRAMASQGAHSRSSSRVSSFVGAASADGGRRRMFDPLATRSKLDTLALLTDLGLGTASACGLINLDVDGSRIKAGVGRVMLGRAGSVERVVRGRETEALRKRGSPRCRMSSPVVSAALMPSRVARRGLGVEGIEPPASTS